ncbi:MAG: ABC transporter substrate-binding protein [Rubrobacteridae bacterium]|nr:ABC transporter substrate-binding protein [Rubrobacteridae bacterium]
MKRAIALIAVIALLFTVGCQSAKQDTTTVETVADKTYKIGVVLSKTGTHASLGLQEEKALLLEMENINKAGGVNEKNIELIVEDDASEPNNAVVAVSKLINEDKVVAIIGSTSAASTMAMKPKVQESKVPLLTMVSDTNVMEAPVDYIYRSAQPDFMMVRKVLDYMYKSLLQKFAILYEETPYGKSGADELNKRAKGARLTVTSTQSYTSTDTDMIKQLKKIALTNPKAIVVWGSSQTTAIVAKNMKELKMTQPLIAGPAIATKSFMENAGTLSEGVVFPAGKMLIPESTKGAQADVVKAFTESYKNKYNEEPSTYAGFAYDAVHILKEALAATEGDLSLLKLKLNSTWGYVGVSGVFTYSAKDHDGTKGSDLILVKIVNGKWMHLDGVKILNGKWVSFEETATTEY